MSKHRSLLLRVPDIGSGLRGLMYAVLASWFATPSMATAQAGDQWAPPLALQGRASGEQHALGVPSRPGTLPQTHRLSNGRDVIVLTRSGWIMRVDTHQNQVTAEFKADAAFTSAALSAPLGGAAALLMAASDAPPALLVFTEDLQFIKSLPLAGAAGERASGALTVLAAPERNSFITALDGVAEMWEISYDPKAPEIGLGLVHDFQYREGQFVRGYLNPKRTTLPCPAQAMALSPSGHDVLTLHHCVDPAESGAVAMFQTTHLDVRKPTSRVMLPCRPALVSPLVWREAAASVASLTHMRAAGDCKLP